MIKARQPVRSAASRAGSAAIFSLIETAKANDLEPYRYLRFLFERLPLVTRPEDYKNLLPQYLDPAAINPTT